MAVVYNKDEKMIANAEITFGEWRKTEPFVDTDGIYVPLKEYSYDDIITYKLFMSKEIFQAAFKEYILKEGLLDVQSKEHKDN